MILSSRQLERFTPRDLCNEDGTVPAGAPVYLVMPANPMTRARWRRDVAAVGAKMRGRHELMDILRQGIREFIIEDQHGKFLTLLDEWADAAEYAEEVTGAGSPETRAAAAEKLRDVSWRVSHFENQMRAYGPYAQALADQQYWLNVAPLIAARHFIVGWENVDVPFARVNDMLPEATLAALPEDHVAEAGWYAIRMMHLTQDDVKNSGGPSSSGSSRKRSRPARKVRGSSGAKSNTKTRQTVSRTGAGTS